MYTCRKHKKPSAKEKEKKTDNRKKQNKTQIETIHNLHIQVHHHQQGLIIPLPLSSQVPNTSVNRLPDSSHLHVQ